jgi:hypothetical protein
VVVQRQRLRLPVPLTGASGPGARVMIVFVRMRIEAPDDSRPSAVMAVAADAVNQGSPYKVTLVELADPWPQLPGPPDLVAQYDDPLLDS